MPDPVTALPAAPVRAWLRARARAGTRPGGYAERAYLWLLAVLIGGAVLAGNAPRLVALLTQGRPVTPAPGILLAVGLLWYAAVLLGAARLGPLAAAPARLGWLLPSPTSRRGLLRPTAFAVLALATVAGLLHGGFVAWASVTPTELPVLLAGGIAGLALGGLAILAQTFTDGASVLLERSALVLGAVAAALTVLAPSGRFTAAAALGPWAWPQAAADGMSPGALAAVGVAAVGVAALALLRLDRVRLASLAAGGTLAQTVSTGVVTLDLGTAARAVEERRWAGRSPRRTGLPRLPGRFAVLAHDVTALRRSPGRLALAAAALLPPALLAGIAGPGPVLAGTWLLCGFVALGTVTGNARRDRDLPALGRLLGLSGRALLTGRLVLPVAVGAGWAAGSLALLAGDLPGAGPAWLLLGAVAGPGLAVGALRAARRGAVRHDLPPLVTPMGMVPTGPLHRLVTGVDLGLLCTLPVLLALGTGDPAGALPAQALASLLGVAGFGTVAGAERRRGAR
ncbi:DUF6297 family protein [Plantactinospora sp. ZYX-F-223]|uniref:DUF6297 family protein n=1 Tax=Plantactinospora sp. ZYX-F-223 TaxID=3144103 RepID=UPI0031FD9797